MNYTSLGIGVGVVFLVVLMLFSILSSGPAHALQWDECDFAITKNPENVGPKEPDGWKIYIKDSSSAETSVDLGDALTYSCENVFDIYTEGDYTANATAYNSAGESDRTTPDIQFTIDPSPPVIPSIPGGFSVQIRTLTIK